MLKKGWDSVKKILVREQSFVVASRSVGNIIDMGFYQDIAYEKEFVDHLFMLEEQVGEVVSQEVIDTELKWFAARHIAEKAPLSTALTQVSSQLILPEESLVIEGITYTPTALRSMVIMAQEIPSITKIGESITEMPPMIAAVEYVKDYGFKMPSLKSGERLHVVDGLVVSTSITDQSVVNVSRQSLEQLFAQYNLPVNPVIAYGVENVAEALQLLKGKEKYLIAEPIKYFDEVAYRSQELQKINSNERWKTFKFDIEIGNKTKIGTIDEAMAAIECEERG